MIKKLLEHPIISSVIAGLILLIIPTQFISLFWNWLKNIPSIIFDFFSIGIEIPLWILIPISLFVLIRLLKIIRKHTYNREEDLIINDNSSNKDELPQLSSIEEQLLQVFVSEDGSYLKVGFIMMKLNTTNLRLGQVLESLIHKNLLMAHKQRYEETLFSLTNKVYWSSLTGHFS